MTAALLAPLALVLVAIFFVPFRITVRAAFDGKLTGDLLIAWMWGLAAVDCGRVKNEIGISIGGRRILRFQKKSGTDKGSRRFMKPPRLTTEGMSELLHQTPSFLDLTRRVSRSLSPRGRLAIGLGDPAETGFCAGTLASGLAAIPVPIRIEPDFESGDIFAEGILMFRIVLCSLMLIMARFILSRDRIRFLISCIKGGKRNGTC